MKTHCAPWRRTLVAVAVSVYGTAQAQQVTSADAAATDSSSTGVTEIVITGVRANLDKALNTKRDDDHVVEAISADSAGALPNVTIAEALVRLPGVNGTRDRGNQSQASVRGLGPRLVLGTVNGREVASTEPDRNVRWEMYPTEVVSDVKVYKSQSADLIGGGVAATIDIGTVSPMDYKGPEFSTTIGGAYYDKGKDVPGYSPYGYRGSFSWIKQVDDNWGFAFAANIQDQKNAYPSVQGWGFTDDSSAMDVDGDGTLDYSSWGGQTELKQLDQKREGLMGAVQWRSGNWDVKLDGLYSDNKINEDQNQTWFNSWAYSVYSASNPYATAGSSYTLAGNDIVAGTLAGSYAEMDQVVSLYDEDKWISVVGLNTKWTGDEWTFSGDLAYSAAKRQNTWSAVKFVSFPETVSYDMAAGHKPSISVSSTDLSDTPVPSWSSSIGQVDGPETLKDEVTSFALNGSRLIDSNWATSVDFGARAATRTKRHTQDSYTEYGNDAPLSDFSDLLTSYSVPDFDVPPVLLGNVNQLADLAFGGFDSSAGVENMLEHWKVKEDTTEAFIKLNFANSLFDIPYTGNVGVRVMHVGTTSTGYDNTGSDVVPSKADNDYTNALFSGTLTSKLTEDNLLRLAAANVIARPPLDEMRTGRQLDDPAQGSGQLYGSGGNPKLDPFKAKQLDVSYEWYFHPESLFAIAGYSKWVDSIIGYKQDHEEINGYDYLITGPFNGGGGHIYGVEGTLQLPFFFIPGMKNFGIYANFAHVESNIHEFSPESNPLPMSGLAKDTAGLDLWYSNGTYEARVGYKYHSPFTTIYGWDASQLTRMASETTIDASTSWNVTEAVSVKLQANNLTDERQRLYFDNDPNRLARYDLYGRRYTLDMTYKF